MKTKEQRPQNELSYERHRGNTNTANTGHLIHYNHNLQTCGILKCASTTTITVQYEINHRLSHQHPAPTPNSLTISTAVLLVFPEYMYTMLVR